jgi:hypothetical protein
MKTIITHKNPNFLNEFVNRVKLGHLPQIAIGFPGSKCGSIRYPVVASSAEGKAPAEPPRVVDVAFWNNYGTKDIPARRFMQVGQKRCEREMKKMIALCVDKMLDKKMTAAEAGDMLGEKAAAIMKKTVREWETPPNAPSTIARKGVNAPLRDTGLLLTSMTFEVRTAPAGKQKGRK